MEDGKVLGLVLALSAWSLFVFFSSAASARTILLERIIPEAG
jgi:hypothetical protein